MPDTMKDSTHSLYTAELKRALRRAETVCFDFEDGQVTIRLAKQLRSSDPFEDGRRVSIRFPGFKSRINTGYLDQVAPEADSTHVHYSWEQSNAYTPARGCWVITSSQFHEPLRAAFESIPIGAELMFSVGLDAHSNGYCARARLHADVLRVTATKGKTLRVFMLDATVCAHNTARFGYMG